MKIKIGDLTKRQISKICQQREGCTIVTDGSICPLYNGSEHRCMIGTAEMDDYDDIEIEIPEEYYNETR